MKKCRLFFALWLPDEVRESIVNIARPVLQGIQGRIIRPQNLHMTLYFIGPVTEDVRDCLHKSAASITFTPFNISLDHFGFFNRARIFWMAAQQTPVELTLLKKNLGEALLACDFLADRRPYSPHVSLLRKVEQTAIEAPVFSIDWHVETFVLVESVTDADGVQYKVLEKYPLQVQ